jgi:hypothetical protein
VFGNTASTALSVQQLGTGNVFRFSNAAGLSNVMVMNNLGYVGIGETNPASKLQIQAGSNVIYSIATYPGQNIGQGVGAVLPMVKLDNLIGGSNDIFMKIIGRRHTAGNDWTGVSQRIQHQVDATDMGYMEFNPGSGSQGTAFGNGTTEHMRIDSSGRVGIGTTSPSSNFQVAQGGTANLGNGLYTQLNSMGQTAASLLAGYNTGSGPTLSGGEYTWTIGGGDTNGAITNTPPFVPGGTYLITWNVRSTSAGVTFNFENPSFNSLYASPTLTSSYQNLSFYVTIPSNGQALTNYRVYGGSTKNIIWNAYSVQRLDTLVTGNLGIGTTSPGYTTEISTSTSSTNTSFLGLTNPYIFGFNTGLNIGSSIVYSSRWQGDGLSGIVEMCKIDGRKEQNANYGDSYLAFQTRYTADRVNGGVGVLSEKMRVTSNGFVGIGTTTPGYTLDVVTPLNAVTWSGYMWYNNTTGNPALSGTDYIAVNANGAYRTTSGGFLKVSDVRIKKNIQPISNVFDAVMALKPCTFQYIDEAKLGSQTVQGFVAQEVEQVLPGVVNKTGKGYVPDVYMRATAIGPTVTLPETPKNINLVGTRVQVFYQDSSNVEAVFEANVTSFSDNTITFDKEVPASDVFVYGTYTEQMYSVSNESMVPTLVAAIQQLSAENAALKARLDALEARIS